MRDRRTVDELSIEELEEILRLRKAQARLERLRRLKGTPMPRDPLALEGGEGRPPSLPRGHRNYADEGATAGFRARPVEPEAEPRPSRGVNWAWVRDKALLVLEVAALLGLIIVLLGTLDTLRELNEQARAAQMTAVPSPTPTPLIRVAVLPGGHTPPDAQGRSEPAPIPEHLRPLVGVITPLPVPTPGPEQAIRIRIPSIGVDAPVVEGDDWESLKRGAGHHIGSANPGERGNCIISAHNDIYGEIFRDLPKVQIGDVVEVYTARQVYRYQVSQIRIVDPTDVSVMYPTSTPVLTLISCYPYGVDTHRIVVIAELIP